MNRITHNFKKVTVLIQRNFSYLNFEISYGELDSNGTILYQMENCDEMSLEIVSVEIRLHE